MNEQIIDYLSKITFEQFLGFIYFIIPTGLSVWAVYYIRKSRFYYVERNSIKLHDDIVKIIPDLKIKYKDSDINENLIFFKGTVLFKSHTDIKGEDIDQEITIYSPDSNAVWKHFEITKASDGYQPNFRLMDNKAIIDKSMLKINDFISFAGLLDSKNTNLLISHRIFNVVPRSVKFKEVEFKSNKQTAIILTVLVGLIAFTFLYAKNQSVQRLKNQTLYSWEFKTSFFKDKTKIDISKLETSFDVTQKKRLSNIKLKNDRKLDSLINVYKKSRSDKDYIFLLQSQIDGILKNVSYYPNPYSKLESESTLKLDTLLKNKTLNEKEIYKINDSISVKFNRKESTEKEEEKTFSDYIIVFFEFLTYLFFLLIFGTMSYSWFTYFTLKRLLKIYHN